MPKSISELYPPIYSEAEIPVYSLPEIAAHGPTQLLFEKYIFGHLHIDTPVREINAFDSGVGALGGLARRKQLKISLRHPHGHFEFTLLIYLPTQVSGPAPLFLGLNFMGNHTVNADPAIALPLTWSPLLPEGGTWASETKRGSWGKRWPLEMLMRRGYGVATVYCGDFAPDHPDHFTEGVLNLQHNADTEPNMRGGAIAAWARGLSYALDALITLPEIDRKRVAVIGHSRLGKAALWAGACDPRFSLVISNNSGSGGAALFRRRIGERIVHLNASFPHWFAKAFRSYDEKESDLPVDQHQLLALVAPRALYVTSADEDKWSDPLGEYLSLAAAAPAWKTKLPDEFPAVNQPLHLDQLGYHLRSGPHDILEYDWQQFADFADRIWK